MKKLLLALAAGLSAVSVAAQASYEMLDAAQPATVAIAPLQVAAPKVLKSTPLGKKYIVQVVTDESGYTYKRMVTTDNPNAPIKNMRRSAAPKTNAAATTLNETFEGSDGSKSWQPAGWSAESKVAKGAEPWVVAPPFEFLKGYGGTYAEMCDLTEVATDEWLYSAPVKVAAGQSLQVSAWFDLIFGLDFSYLDMDTFEFTEWHPSKVLRIWIKEEGAAEWTLLKDFFDDAKGKSFDELFDIYTSEFEKHTFDMSQYAGKTIVIGFQYEGKDGNGCGIDNVTLGIPTYEPTYEFPASTLFYGVSTDLSLLGLTVPVLPVYAPITWPNTTKEVGKSKPSYTWTYFDAIYEPHTVQGTDLTASFTTNYETELSAHNNFVDSPILTASAEGWADGSYSLFGCFQAGGKGQFPNGDGYTQYGLSVSDATTEGYTYLVSGTTPYFGYSKATVDMWTGIFFSSTNGNQTAKIVAVANTMDAHDSPLVINGCWTHAYIEGLKSDAEFTLSICPLAGNGTVLAPLGTATIKGSDIAKSFSNGNYRLLQFTFDKPVVISTAVCDKYIVRLSGFDGSATSFAPIQSYYGSYNGVNHGYAEYELFDGISSTISTFTCEYFSNLPEAFGFNLDAVYPWLEGDDEATVQADAPATLALDSYYDGSEIAVATSHPNITATVSGKFDKATLTISTTSTEPVKGTVTLTAPGVTHTVLVEVTAGVDDIVSDTKTVTATYDMHGRAIDAHNLSSGIYLRRHSDGSVSKVVVR